MATIQKRKRSDGKYSYRAIVRVLGHPTVAKTFKRKSDATLWAQNVESDLRCGRWAPSIDSLKRTTAEAIDRYIENTLPMSGNRDSEKTKKQLLWWKSKIGGHRLSALSAAVISEWRDKLATDKKHGGPRAPGTVNRYLAALSTVLNIVVKEWRWLERSPMSGISRLREPSGRVRYLSDDERAALLKACQESENSILYPLVVVAIATGARRGELVGLCWENVDFERSRMTFHETKNGERRTIPIVGHALVVLKRLSKVRKINTDLVFPDRLGNEHTLRVAFYKAMDAAELTDFRFHDLRHTAASYLAMNGATTAEIAEILGHKTLQMVKRYSHLTEQHTSKVLERMNEGIFNV
jgi:integrase